MDNSGKLVLLVDGNSRVASGLAACPLSAGRPQAVRRSEYLRTSANQPRNKLHVDPAAPQLVTEPRLGYRLVAPDQPS